MCNFRGFVTRLNGFTIPSCPLPLGQRLPAFCTASGKAILAFMPEENMKRIVERGTPKYTPRTLTSPQEFYEDLHLPRERGFAIAEQEF